MMNVREQFGEIDIYLFDQLLKERFVPGASILDAGCGGAGRNIVYFIRNNYEVYGVDQNQEAVAQVRRLAVSLNHPMPATHFLLAAVEEMPFSSARFDAVISSAVLHFARDRQHFDAMVGEMWRVLKPGGLFFARLASSIGIEELITPLGGNSNSSRRGGGGSGRYLLPDASERFLVDEALLASTTERLGGAWLEPLKTTNVQNLRCMSTWVLQRQQQQLPPRSET